MRAAENGRNTCNKASISRANGLPVTTSQQLLQVSAARPPLVREVAVVIVAVCQSLERVGSMPLPSGRRVSARVGAGDSVRGP